jgi:nitroreductase
MDIGIAASHLVCAACEEGLSTCILGWLDDQRLREICDLDAPVRLVIALGYAAPDDALREKKRKRADELIAYKN